MKQQKKWLTTALVVAGALIVANSSQAQTIFGGGVASGIAMGGGSFLATEYDYGDRTFTYGYWLQLGRVGHSDGAAGGFKSG